MNGIETTPISRRRLMAIAGATLLTPSISFGKYDDAALPVAKTELAGASTSFSPLKQIDAGALNVGYAEAGPANGQAVILLHGWPYDIYSFVDVAPRLASAGYRVIVPYLRGYGTTRFLSGETLRNGQQSVVALDIIALMDALHIGKAILGGLIGVREPRTSSRHCGLNAARLSSLSAVISSATSRLERCRCRQARSSCGGTNTILLRNAAGPATTNTAVTLRSSFGSSHRRNGRSMRPRLLVRRHPLTIRITSPSWSTTIVGGSDWLKASPNMTSWKNGLPRAPSFLYPRSHSKATPMERPTPMLLPIATNFQANTNTGSSTGASDIISRKKRPRPLPRPLWMQVAIEGRRIRSTTASSQTRASRATFCFELRLNTEDGRT